MTGLVADVKYALRLFRKSPGFAAAAIGTLALGISANTVIFSGLEALVLRPVPAPHPERICVVREAIRTSGARYGVAYPDLLDFRQAPAFEHFAGLQIDTFNLTGQADVERIRGTRVTSHFFEAMGLPAVAGRIIAEDDDRPGAAPVAVVGYGFAERRFGGAREALGRTLQLDGVTRTIVGVMPPPMRFPMGFSDVWIPLAASPASAGRGAHFLLGLGRLRAGQTIAEGHRQLDMVARRIEAEFPGTNKDMGVTTMALTEQISRGPRKALIVLSTAVGFILLIGCANLANLSLARAVHRAREFAVRQAVGAGRWRLVRQLLAESVTLSVAGGVTGLLLAAWGMEVLIGAMPPELRPMGGLALNARVLAFTAALSVLTGLIFGIAPAWRILGAASLEALRDGGRAGGGGPVRSRTANVLVVAEVALAVTLLGGASLLLAALNRLYGTGLGFDPKGLLTAEVSAKADRAQVIDDLLRRLNRAPGVRSAAVVNWLPMTNNSSRNYTVDGVQYAGKRPPLADYRVASPRYLEAAGIQLRKGRFFNDADRRGAEPVAVINERLAGAAWPGKDALGKRIAICASAAATGELRTVVGVIGNVRHGGPAAPAADPTPELYIPFAQQPGGMLYLAIRTAGDPAAFASSLQQVAKEVDPTMALGLVRPMERVIADALTPARFTTGLLAIFAVLALLLSVMGLYGVIAYVVARRTHEFGVRLALGATSGGLLRLVSRRALWLAGCGTVLGLLAAAAVTKMLSALVYGVRPEPLLFALIAAILLGVAAAASYVPLRRALASGPLQALRSE